MSPMGTDTAGRAAGGIVRARVLGAGGGMLRRARVLGAGGGMLRRAELFARPPWEASLPADVLRELWVGAAC